MTVATEIIRNAERVAVLNCNLLQGVDLRFERRVDAYMSRYFETVFVHVEFPSLSLSKAAASLAYHGYRAHPYVLIPEDVALLELAVDRIMAHVIRNGITKPAFMVDRSVLDTPVFQNARHYLDFFKGVQCSRDGTTLVITKTDPDLFTLKIAYSLETNALTSFCVQSTEGTVIDFLAITPGQELMAIFARILTGQRRTATSGFFNKEVVHAYTAFQLEFRHPVRDPITSRVICTRTKAVLSGVQFRIFIGF